tara:strand:- start:8899 stop:12753 length:3855 start_codon:yes stop_codon:yes gene_type:complete
MTVSSEVSRVGPFSGNGSTTVFDLTFLFSQDDDLEVTLTNATGTESILSKGTHYSVSGAGTATGTVTMVTAPASGEKLTVRRKPVVTQPDDLTNQTDYIPNNHEARWDAQVMQTQRVKEESDRALKIPVSDTGIDLTLPTSTVRASKIMSFDSLGNPSTIAVDSLSLATLQAFTDWKVDAFTAGSNQTVYNLSGAPGQKTNTTITIDGVTQELANYSLAAQAITLSTAPATGSKVEIRYGQASSTFVPASSSITFAQLADTIDEDNMASDSATKIPTQQSVKAYVDANAVLGAEAVARSYGVVPGSNITTAFNSMIASVRSAGITRIQFETGTYQFDSAPSDLGGLRLVGAGSSDTIFRVDYNPASETAGVFNFSQGKGGGMRGIQVAANSSCQQGVAIKVFEVDANTDGDFTLIEDVVITEAHASGLWYYGIALAGDVTSNGIRDVDVFDADIFACSQASVYIDGGVSCTLSDVRGFAAGGSAGKLQIVSSGSCTTTYCSVIGSQFENLDVDKATHTTIDGAFTNIDLASDVSMCVVRSPRSTGTVADAGTQNTIDAGVTRKGNLTLDGDVTTTGDIELGHASDTTIARSSAGTVTIEGAEIRTGTVAVANGGTGSTSAGAARTALGVDAAGTDNSTNVTLAGTPDYITISGQEITRNAIDLTTDVSGALPIANGGTGATSLTDGGVLLGSGSGAITAMGVLADGEVIVGDGSGDPVAESGATLRTSIGVGTGDSPQFTALGLGVAPTYPLDIYRNAATTHVRSAIRNEHANAYNATHIYKTANRQWEVGAFDAAVGLTSTWGVRDDTGTSYRFLINSSGQAAIGDTTTVTNAQLTITGSDGAAGSLNYVMAIRNSDAYSTTPAAGILFQAKYNSGGAYADAGGIEVVKENATDGEYGFGLGLHTRANGSAITEKVRIDPSGNLIVQPNSTSQTISVEASGGGAKIEMKASGGTLTTIGSTNNVPTAIQADGNEAIRVLTDGKVGIGTTSANQLLHLNSAAGAAINMTSGSGYLSQILFGTTAAPNHGRIQYNAGTGHMLWCTNDSATAKMELDDAGVLTLGGVLDAANIKVSGAQGSDGQVLTSTGSGVAWEDAGGGGGSGGAWNVIGTAVANDSASLTVTGLDSTYDTYAIAISDVVPATDPNGGMWLNLNLGDSNGVDSGTGDYSHHPSGLKDNNYSYYAYPGNSSNGIPLAQNAGIATGEGQGALVYLHRPADGAVWPIISGTHVTVKDESAVGSGQTLQGGLVFAARTAVISVDRVQVSYSGANIDSGRLTVWGIAHA